MTKWHDILILHGCLNSFTTVLQQEVSESWQVLLKDLNNCNFLLWLILSLFFLHNDIIISHLISLLFISIIGIEVLTISMLLNQSLDNLLYYLNSTLSALSWFTCKSDLKKLIQLLRLTNDLKVSLVLNIVLNDGLCVQLILNVLISKSLN